MDLIIQRCLQGFEPQFSRRGMKVALAQSQGSPVVAAGPAELEQVLNTIFSNAVEAMKTGGTLGLGWRAAPGGRISIDISDTGPGLTEEQFQKLFTPFQNSKSSGLGVGLARSRRFPRLPTK